MVYLTIALSSAPDWIESFETKDDLLVWTSVVLPKIQDDVISVHVDECR